MLELQFWGFVSLNTLQFLSFSCFVSLEMLEKSQHLNKGWNSPKGLCALGEHECAPRWPLFTDNSNQEGLRPTFAKRSLIQNYRISGIRPVTRDGVK